MASVLDLHTKKVVGHHFSKSMNVELVLQDLSNVIEVQQSGKGLILHIDLGTQCTSAAFSQPITQSGLEHSFSRNYDNARIDSFHAIFNKEEVHHTVYLDIQTIPVH